MTALSVSHRIFENMESGTILELCELVAVADTAADSVKVSVRGGPHIEPSMKLVREALVMSRLKEVLLKCSR